MTTTVVGGISRLYTNDPTIGEGRSGVLTDAWLVIDDEQVAAVGCGRAPAADRAIAAGGRCVIPGFVDSHSHLVFGGDRADEFAARMAGTPYTAGGIASTVAATRASDAEALAARAQGPRGGGHPLGDDGDRDQVRLRADRRARARALGIAHELTDETTLLGAHVVPPEFAGRADDYVELVCTEMVPACAPVARWIDAFCEVGAFDAEQCRAVLEAGRAAGLGLRLHANQLGPGPGVQLAVELGCASADHCTFLSDDDIDALAAGARQWRRSSRPPSSAPASPIPTRAAPWMPG